MENYTRAVSILGEGVKESDRYALFTCRKCESRKLRVNLSTPTAPWICNACGESGNIHNLARKMGVEEVPDLLMSGRDNEGNEFFLLFTKAGRKMLSREEAEEIAGKDTLPEGFERSGDFPWRKDKNSGR